MVKLKIVYLHFVDLIIFHVSLKGKITHPHILSYGINTENLHLSLPSIHAEVSAIKHLPPSKKRHRYSRPEQVNLFVARFSKCAKLQTSRPCIHCIRQMQTEPIKKGYKIKYIYYSGENGEIIKTTLAKLESEEPHYSGYYRRKI